MKYESDIYESDIAEMIHENKMTEFKLGLISEARMREFDKLCLTKKALKNKTAHGDTANIEHAALITA
jgi:DNA-binding transcriptional regulator YiaG